MIWCVVQSKKSLKYNYLRAANFNLMKQILSNVDWVSLLSPLNTDDSELVLVNIPEIPYTRVFSSKYFKGTDFQIYQLCRYRYIVLCGKPDIRS